MALNRREIAKDVSRQSAEAVIASTAPVVAAPFESVRGITAEVGASGTGLLAITEASKRAGQDNNDTKPAAG